MTKSPLSLLWIFILSVFSNSLVFCQSEPMNRQSFEAFIDDYMANVMDRHAHNAVTLSIVKDGRNIFSKGYGIANLSKDIRVTAEESIFRIGSTSKALTYTAIMQLYEQGKLDLDINVNKYLSDFKIPNTFEKPVSIRSILTHSAGFEESYFGHLFVRNENEIIPLKKAVQKYMPSRVSPVGTHSSYSNYGVTLLGVVIENVTGEQFENYIDRHIFKPLKMANSSFEQPLPGHLQKNIAYAYDFENDSLVAQDFTLVTNYTPSAGMSTTADDMAKFMIMHLANGTFNGQHILQPQTAKMMRKRLFGAREGYPGIAYGFYQENINGYLLYGQPGQTLYFLTDMLMDPTNDMGIFISCTGDNVDEIVSGFIPAFYDRYFPQEKTAISIKDAPANFSDRAHLYTGQYFNWQGNFSQIEKLKHLVNGITVNVSDRNTLLITGEYDNMDEYVEVAEHLFQNVDGGDLITFSKNPNGEFVNLHDIDDPTVTYTKAPFYFFRSFNFPAVGLSLVLLGTVILIAIYNWIKKRTQSREERQAWMIALAVSGVNLVFVLWATITGFSYGVKFLSGFPWYFDALMLLPIISSLLAPVQLYKMIQVWHNHFWSAFRRIHYSLATLAALFMIWFYYFWNILGFQYI